MHQTDAMLAHVPPQNAKALKRGAVGQGMDWKLQNRDAGGAELVGAHSRGKDGSHVRNKAAPVQGPGKLGELALGSTRPESANQEQNVPG